MNWDLYNLSQNPDTRKAVTAAKPAMDAALKAAKAAVRGGTSVADAMVTFMYPVMAVHAAAGAWDTEPRAQAWDALEAVSNSYRYRKSGPSGRGEGRTRYYADDVSSFKYLCTIEGKSGSWRVEDGQWKGWEDRYFKTRDEAVTAYLKHWNAL